VDGLGQCILTATAIGQVSIKSDTVAVTAGHDYRTACSVKPNGARVCRVLITWSTGAVSTGPSFTAPSGVWSRIPQFIATAPVGATTLAVSVQVDALAAGETVAIDAWDAREYTG
jgi:hypothetical protein